VQHEVWPVILPPNFSNPNVSIVAGSMTSAGLSSFIAQSFPAKMKALVLAVERYSPFTDSSSVSGLR
jgi:hypothetical protein